MRKRTKETKTRRVSMQDVAKLAGVSQTTVSFVLNGISDANIPQETQDRVRAAVAQLGYRPNAMARSLRSQRSHTIGFISDQVATTPYAGRMIQGAQDVAWEKGKLLFLVNTNNNSELERAAVQTMLERQVEGIVYATMYHRPVTLPPLLKEVPTVLLDCFSLDRSLPSVVPDEAQGGRTATTALLKKGHRRIGFIDNVDPIPATSGRLAGYKQALEEYGITFDSSLLCSDTPDSGGGYRAAMQLMQQADRPTAIFSFNDMMTMGVYDALRKLNLRIPEDVGIISFDNHELIAAHLYPPLSSMELPHYQMGKWAAEELIEMCSKPMSRQPIQHKIECRLIERASF